MCMSDLQTKLRDAEKDREREIELSAKEACDLCEKLSFT
jgi:hypothetical protein